VASGDELQRVETFLSGMPEGKRAAFVDRPGLAALLAKVCDEARAAWPTLAFDEPRFLRHLAGALPDLNVLAQVHAGDLYLACACAAGDRVAAALFHDHFLTEVPRFVSHLVMDSAAVEDLKQDLVARLLTSLDGERPRIGEYAGRGPLGGWLRVAAVHAALNQRRAEGRQLAREAVDAEPAATADPELDFLKVQYRAHFRTAFEATIRALDPEQRSVMRLHHLDGLTLEEIAELYRISRATAARWLAATRRQIMEETRRLLARDHTGPDELESVLRLIRSQLDVSIGRLLRSAG
jgi:RNA polymerase sigma-70 factor (ECF subfamily)